MTETYIINLYKQIPGFRDRSRLPNDRNVMCVLPWQEFWCHFHSKKLHSFAVTTEQVLGKQGFADL